MDIINQRNWIKNFHLGQQKFGRQIDVGFQLLHGPFRLSFPGFGKILWIGENFNGIIQHCVEIQETFCNGPDGQTAASFLSSFVVFMEEEEATNAFLLSCPLGVALETTLVADLGGMMIFSELLKRLTKQMEAAAPPGSDEC